MNIQQLIIGVARVTILPGIEGYNIEIKGTQYESCNELESWSNREQELEVLAEDIAVYTANHLDDEEHEIFLDVLHSVDWNKYL